MSCVCVCVSMCSGFRNRLYQFSFRDEMPLFALRQDRVRSVSLTGFIILQTGSTWSWLWSLNKVYLTWLDTGKTLSYALPVVQSLQAIQPKISRSCGPLALVIVPTREVCFKSGPESSAHWIRSRGPPVSTCSFLISQFVVWFSLHQLAQQTFQTFQKLLKVMCQSTRQMSEFSDLDDWEP